MRLPSTAAAPVIDRDHDTGCCGPGGIGCSDSGDELRSSPNCNPPIKGIACGDCQTIEAIFARFDTPATLKYDAIYPDLEGQNKPRSPRREPIEQRPLQRNLLDRLRLGRRRHARARSRRRPVAQRPIPKPGRIDAADGPPPMFAGRSVRIVRTGQNLVRVRAPAVRG
jgi:hypothetical protein